MHEKISRRAMLQITAGAATAFTGSEWVFRIAGDGKIVKAATENASAWKPVFFTDAEVKQLAAVCEAIIPKTKTPGARDARVHEYIDVSMSVEPEAIQKRFRDGLTWLETRCNAELKKSLADATTEEVTKLLGPLSDTNAAIADDLKPGASFFTDVKGRTIFGFYTSREGWVEDLGLSEHVGMEKWHGCTDGHE